MSKNRSFGSLHMHTYMHGSETNSNGTGKTDPDQLQTMRNGMKVVPKACDLWISIFVTEGLHLPSFLPAFPNKAVWRACEKERRGSIQQQQQQQQRENFKEIIKIKNHKKNC